MLGRQSVLLAMILGMALLTGEAVADSATDHGHSDSPPTPSEPAQGPTGQGMMNQEMMGQSMLRMPQMDPARGRKLFASKGCVVCHAVNGVGGTDAAPLDASTMPGMMNPFEFAAKMWRGAEAMIYLQREELGEQIEFNGDELADIVAFVHHPEEQKKFSESDIPPEIEGLMHHMEVEQSDEHKKEHEKDEHTE
jgi:cytochrome c